MSGVAYHMNDMESNGLVLWNIANNFLNSPEFKMKYGESPTDEEYVNALYQNVLGRGADLVSNLCSALCQHQVTFVLTWVNKQRL